MAAEGTCIVVPTPADGIDAMTADGDRDGREACLDTAYRVHPLHLDDPEQLGGYPLAGRLSSGGMGVVYLGRRPQGGYVAIKIVRAVLLDDPQFRDRFRDEIARARQVPPFCTAEVLDADLDHDPPYLVTEYVDGPSLAEVVGERGPLNAAELHAMAVGVATTLCAIHAAGVVHRDLKPENVLLPPGNPKVIDFGIASMSGAVSRHTGANQVIGTIGYLAPERLTPGPASPVTPAADVFAWGCVVAYACTGRAPFDADSPAATAARIVSHPPRLDGLPEPLRGLVELALARDPLARPTARQLLDMLLDAGAGVRVTPSNGGVGRRRWIVATALAAALVMGGTVALLTGHHATGSAAGSASGPASATPAPGTTLIHDPLDATGHWRDSALPDGTAACRVRDVLTAVRNNRGSYQCGGPDTVLTGDISIDVTTRLLSKGSCAAIWLHWSDIHGGQVLRICQRALTLSFGAPGEQHVFGSKPLEKMIVLNTPVHLRVVIRGRDMLVYRGGAVSSELLLPNGRTQGQIRLGVAADGTDATAPYIATFSGLDVATA